MAQSSFLVGPATSSIRASHDPQPINRTNWTGCGYFSVNAIAQFLAVPRDYWLGDSLEAIDGPVRWHNPSTVDDAGPVMAETLRFLADRALPFLDGAATVDGHLEYLRRRAANINRRAAATSRGRT